jgi:hypothetical protein
LRILFAPDRTGKEIGTGWGWLQSELTAYFFLFIVANILMLPMHQGGSLYIASTFSPGSIPSTRGLSTFPQVTLWSPMVASSLRIL